MNAQAQAVVLHALPSEQSAAEARTETLFKSPVVELVRLAMKAGKRLPPLSRRANWWCSV
ncbi:MAG: hypothetical protein R3C99_19175 [Pirellulaceae bacterium]